MVVSPSSKSLKQLSHHIYGQKWRMNLACMHSLSLSLPFVTVLGRAGVEIGRSRLQGQHMNKNVSVFLNYQQTPLLFIYFIVLCFGSFA